MLSGLAHAAPELTPPADLPPTAATNAVLEAHPAVLAARARVSAALAEGRRLKVGEYEYQASAGYTRRRETGVGGYNDWEMGIERGLRLPGKAKLDKEIGATLADEAEERVGDARHEAARDLIATWYAALRAEGETQAWREQAALLKQQRDVVEKRIKAGDAARMERAQAEAALRQAEAETRRAESAAAEAVAGLSARFPGLPAPKPSPGALPTLAGDASAWVGAALEHNHELAILQKESERMRFQARRQQAELTPDPTLGLRYSRERSGLDNLLGISITLPLPGENRRARVDVATQEARALAQQEAGARARVEGEIRVLHARLRGALSRLESLEEMARHLDGYADLAWRAYQMGETPLWEALNARKSTRDARREALLSRLDVHEAAARLLLDSHRLWPMAEAGPHHQ
ncbi:MAG: TolC family protein [Pseudomonadota bacterium]|nr:TolC family protein [Pseudomonadota bacterium]MDP1902665.1 TolC family protein [Pseudomonadota bacterium]MDP2351163.1 TolC family protein [Pseudomonadota bacterium]